MSTLRDSGRKAIRSNRTEREQGLPRVAQWLVVLVALSLEKAALVGGRCERAIDTREEYGAGRGGGVRGHELRRKRLRSDTPRLLAHRLRLGSNIATA